ncbi:MAG: hypothetical protein MZW92_77775 [Comamonadaceae bacterium]|nr:hypothetical protein [Comamonadaceae bacterium]
MLVLSAGFAEIGDDGRRLQELALTRARALRHPPARAELPRHHAAGDRPERQLSRARRRARARWRWCRSRGAVVAALLDYAWTAGFGFSSVISTGAGSDVEFSEILDYLALDPATRSILLYVEGVHDARALHERASARRPRVKPVVVLKVGRHVTGAAGGDEPHRRAGRRRRGVRRRPAPRRRDPRRRLSTSCSPRPNRSPPGACRAACRATGWPSSPTAAARACWRPTRAADTDVAAGQALAGGAGHAQRRRCRSPGRTAIRSTSSATPTPRRFADGDEACCSSDPANDGVLLLFTPTIALDRRPRPRSAVLPRDRRPPTSRWSPCWLGETDAGRGPRGVRRPPACRR